MSSLNDLKTKIENLPKEHQIEVLRKLKDTNEIVLNENNNGVFINLSQLEDKHIKLLNTYLSYINTQNEHLSVIENKKNDIKENFFSQT